MLNALHVQDFVLIDELSLPLGEGLTALTGETGATLPILLTRRVLWKNTLFMIADSKVSVCGVAFSHQYDWRWVCL
jgi:hypothetical protein